MRSPGCPPPFLVASLGHRVTTAGDGREALGLLESTPFDLVSDLREQLEPGEGRPDRAKPEEVAELLDSLQECAAKIDEHGQRADSIVRGMLMHSRGRTGERQACDLNALVGQSVNLAYHALRGLDSTFNVAPIPPTTRRSAG